MNKAIWYLRQLLPLRYETTCTIEGKRRFCTWRMWLGRCYGVRWYTYWPQDA